MQSSIPNRKVVFQTPFFRREYRFSLRFVAWWTKSGFATSLLFSCFECTLEHRGETKSLETTVPFSQCQVRSILHSPKSTSRNEAFGETPAVLFLESQVFLGKTYLHTYLLTFQPCFKGLSKLIQQGAPRAFHLGWMVSEHTCRHKFPNGLLSYMSGL